MNREKSREAAREAATVMLGFADGKEVQCRRRGTVVWFEFEIDFYPAWNWEIYEYILKPTPVLRPWTADEVPLGAWMRYKQAPYDRSVLGWVSNQADRDMWLEEREHSTDGGLIWKPCGVEEVAK